MAERTTISALQSLYASAAQVVKVKVTGMHCSSCSTAVQNALTRLEGVMNASVSLLVQQAEVEYDPTRVQQVDMHLARTHCCFTEWS